MRHPLRQFNVLTIFPQYFEPFTSQGVMGKAFAKKIFNVNLVNPRDFTNDRHQTVDSPPYGGGDGMLMKYSPIKEALMSLKKQGLLGRVYNFSPQGTVWSNERAQAMARSCAELPCTFICGRYAGVDQRVIESFVDEEISMGDYILSGAELAAQVVMDSVLRFVPGVLGHPDSNLKESFYNHLLEAPQFTQPQVVDGYEVPSVLLSGHHKNIELWKQKVAIVRTSLLRPDLLSQSLFSRQEVSEAFYFVSQLPDQELQSLGILREFLVQYLKGEAKE